MESLKKFLPWIFAAVVVAQGYIGISSVMAAKDAIKNGAELKFHCGVDAIDAWEAKEFKMNVSLRDIETEYSSKLYSAERAIRRAKKVAKKDRDAEIADSVYVGQIIPVSLRSGKDGFAEVSAYGDQADSEPYLRIRLDEIIFAKREKDVRHFLVAPVAVFDLPNLKMSFSQKSVENINAYIKGIPKDERSGYAIARVKAGKIFVIDVVVNGKSLSEVGSGKL